MGDNNVIMSMLYSCRRHLSMLWQYDIVNLIVLDNCRACNFMHQSKYTVCKYPPPIFSTVYLTLFVHSVSLGLQYGDMFNDVTAPHVFLLHIPIPDYSITYYKESV